MSPSVYSPTGHGGAGGFGISIALTDAFDAFASAAAADLGGLFIVAPTFDVPHQAFFFAHLLEAPDHLFYRLISSCLNLYHRSKVSLICMAVPNATQRFILEPANDRDFVASRKHFFVVFIFWRPH